MTETSATQLTVVLLSGASSVHTVRWANGLAGKGLNVHLVTQHAPFDPLDPSIVIHRFPHAKGLGYIVNGPRLKRLLTDLKPDVVNAHYATGYGTLARWVGNTPLIINVWGTDVFAFPEASPIHRKLLRTNLERADVVVSTSNAMAERVRQVCPMIKGIKIVPFGVEMDRFQPSPKTDLNKTLTVGTVKSLAPTYGIDRLIQAFAQLKGDVVLRIVGSGPQEQELKHLVQQKGLSDRVTFVPRVAHEHVPSELAKLDVYVALSRQESFGVAVIEASACGIPVVVSDVGGLPEVVIHGTSGYLVPENDIDLASRRITELLEDPALREQMGSAGREFVAKNFSWDHSLQSLITVYSGARKRM